jgi:intein/homing endonuclease
MFSDTKPEDLDTEGEDHCLVGDTQVLTDNGYVSICDLVGTEGRVMSHDGKYHNYFDVRLTRKQADIYAIELEDGTVIKCTDDHRFMLPDGEWIHAKDLMAGMEVKTYGSTSN